MAQIVITHPDGSTTLLNSGPRTSGITKAEQSVGLLAEDTVAITVKSAEALDFALGDTIEVYGNTYTLNQLPTVKKTGTRKFEYTLTFEGVQYELIDAQFLLPDNTIGDSFTGNLLDFLQIVIVNVLRVFPNKWVLGEYPQETESKTLTFSGRNCLDVLQDLCKEYSQEFEITQNNGIRTLNIRKAGVAFPYTFRYGKTGGLYELTRQNINSKNVVTRLYVYGGSNNLGSKYRHSHLCLPGKSKNGSYIENAAAIAAFGLKENTKVFDNIFPNRYGEVSALGSKYYAFVDDTMNFDLNERFEDTPEDYLYWLSINNLTDSSENQAIYKNSVAGNTTKWIIAGVDPKIKITAGNLAGYEFDVHKYDHATKEIQVVPFTDENGMEFPSKTNAAFQFGVDGVDKYIFTNINLPDAYKEEAEAKLQEEGETYYNQYCQPQVQYALSIDQNFIKQFAGELTVVNLFAVGDYIHVEDDDLGVNKSIRITAFTRDLLQPYKYSITLGDSVTKSTYTRIISDIREIDEIIKINNLADPSKARRNWRASQEVLAMVFDPDGKYYSEKIRPLSIETTMLQVGAKSMQFVLQNVRFEPNYEGNPNKIMITGGQLTHYTIEEDVKYWEILQATYSNLVSNTAYYIYARCSKTTAAGSIILATTQRKVDYEEGYYTFMIGVLNSVPDDDDDGLRPARLISLTYGASTINGRFIKTGRIESSGGGSTYFDLDEGIIGGRIRFLSGNTEQDLDDWTRYIEQDLDDLDDIIVDLEDYVDGAFKDGVIEEAEAKAIEKYLNTINDTMAKAEASFLKVFANTYLEGSAKIALENAKINLWGQRDTLLSTINNAIEDGKTTVAEKNAVDSAFNTFNSLMSAFQSALEEANKAIQAKLDAISKGYVDDLSGIVNNLEDYVDGAFKDGIINFTEARSIEKYLNSLNETKLSVDSSYSQLSNNEYLEGDAKTNLDSAKDELNTAYTNLINSINTAIADGATIPVEKADVDAKFGLFNAALATYQARVEEANKAIQNKLKSYADAAQDTADDAAAVAADALAKANTSKAITDNFGTQIGGIGFDSALISTVLILLRELNSQQDTAGISGIQGAQRNLPAFWAGGMYAEAIAGTAKAIIYHDGRVKFEEAEITGEINATTGVLQNVTVEGIIDAISGSIGGFDLEQGRIGSTNDLTSTGLSLTNDNIRFRFNNGKVMASIGDLNWLGYSNVAEFRLNDDYNYTIGSALFAQCRSGDGSMDWMYPQRAFEYDGNIYGTGKICNFEEGYIGQPYTDIIINRFNTTHKFHFTANTTSNMTVDLPTKSMVDSQTGNKVVMFDLEIVCDHGMANKITIRSQPGAQIYDNNAGTVSEIEMEKGDALRLRYYNGGYNILFKAY